MLSHVNVISHKAYRPKRVTEVKWRGLEHNSGKTASLSFCRSDGVISPSRSGVPLRPRALKARAGADLDTRVDAGSLWTAAGFHLAERLRAKQGKQGRALHQSAVAGRRVHRAVIQPEMAAVKSCKLLCSATPELQRERRFGGT